MRSRHWLSWLSGAALYILGTASIAFCAENIILGTDWRAQAEHGGYYQALATGLYESVGLDVEIRQGGPQVNHAQLLAAGRINVWAAPNSFSVLNYGAQGIPMIAVAALFQKDPAVLIAHEGQGIESLADLRGRKIMISPDTRVGFWRFLKATYDFSDDQIAPYTFNLAPFLADPTAVQQGYLTSEPFQIARAGQEARVMLLADAGYSSYASVLIVPRRLAEENPGLVQRLVAASAAGWKNYLHADPTPADALVKRDNPDMTDAMLAYARGKLREYRIVESGDPSTLGIGAMTDERWRAFFDMVARQGLYPESMDYRSTFTLKFVQGTKIRGEPP